MENSPPGIQFIPVGALPVGTYALGTVGVNEEPLREAVDGTAGLGIDGVVTLGATEEV